MLTRTLLSFLVAVPLYSSTISPVQLRRVTSIRFFFAAALFFNVLYPSILGSGVSIYSGLFHVSSVTLTFDILICTVRGLILLRSTSYPLREYSLILLFSTIGASFLISRDDLVSLYLSIELQSFSVYILTAL